MQYYIYIYILRPARICIYKPDPRAYMIHEQYIRSRNESEREEEGRDCVSEWGALIDKICRGARGPEIYGGAISKRGVYLALSLSISLARKGGRIVVALSRSDAMNKQSLMRGRELRSAQWRKEEEEARVQDRKTVVRGREQAAWFRL